MLIRRTLEYATVRKRIPKGNKPIVQSRPPARRKLRIEGFNKLTELSVIGHVGDSYRSSNRRLSEIIDVLISRIQPRFLRQNQTEHHFQALEIANNFPKS